MAMGRGLTYDPTDKRMYALQIASDIKSKYSKFFDGIEVIYCPTCKRDTAFGLNKTYKLTCLSCGNCKFAKDRRKTYKSETNRL